MLYKNGDHGRPGAGVCAPAIPVPVARQRAETADSPEACRPASLVHTAVNSKREMTPPEARWKVRTDACMDGGHDTRTPTHKQSTSLVIQNTLPLRESAGTRHLTEVLRNDWAE